MAPDAADGRDADDDATFEEAVLNGRLCLVSRQSRPAGELIRFVRAPDGGVVPDLKRKLPGRGAHVAADAESVRLAVKRNVLQRAFGPGTSVPADLPGLVDTLLVKSALGAIGLARKAGQIVTGAAKVEAEIRGGRAAAILQATDGAADGFRKVEGAALATQARTERPAPPVYRLFAADELGLALGGWNVVHAAVLAGDAGSAALKRLQALENYRGASAPPVPRRPDGATDRGIASKTDEGLQTGGATGTNGRCGDFPAQEAEA